MTVPRYLASSYYFDENLEIDDCADIVTNLKAILLAQTPAWTNPGGGGVMKSPVDSAGRFMTLELSAPSASRFQIIVRDQNGITVCTREIALITGPLPTTINYYTGQYHCFVEALTGSSGVGEWVGAFMTDPTDYDNLGVNQNYVIGTGYRTSAGAVDSQVVVCDQWFMVESGAGAVRQRSRSVGSAAGVSPGLIDAAGNPQSFPFDVYGIPSGVGRWMGSLYQVQLFDPSVPAGVIKSMAIDDSTPAKWRTSIAPSTAQGVRMAIRVPV